VYHAGKYYQEDAVNQETKKQWLAVLGVALSVLVIGAALHMIGSFPLTP
jgi:hypothetical protein